MGKRSRRARAKHRASGKLAKRAQVERVSTAEPKLEPKAMAHLIGPAVRSAQDSPYQYVLPELRRIGIIAGVLFFVLFMLTFILS